MKATVTWKGDMTFTGESKSGFPVQMDSDVIVGGTNSGVRPMEMIALGLAGCTAMDVISILRKKRQQVTRKLYQCLYATMVADGVFNKHRIPVIPYNQMLQLVSQARNCGIKPMIRTGEIFHGE